MIFVTPDFWSGERCDSVRGAIGRSDLSRAEVFDSGYRVDETARRTFEADVDPDVLREVEDSIAAVRPRVAEFYATTLVGSEGPAFLRYPAGGFYRVHRDCLPGGDEEFPRQISVVVFVTDACEGGVLRIYGPSMRDIQPVAGTLVAFPATWLHEVLPVTAGIRDAVVDWFY
ncbi:MAG TPA: 2OG-Fe(II) oxygenase [Vicinamibacterales bacterium]|jgi:predicted 2-oxoglutarate/Fe(II)-dependent dioxygenase YbiX|nr:2OG-Fe(II) oxygenase [Vicinamibacterales bacterium]